MSFITDRLADRHKGYKLDLAFDVVLEVQNLFKEEALTDTDKINIALNMLVINRRRLNKLNVLEKSELLKDIFKRFINVEPKRKSNNNKKVVDFEEDAEYIYSSFFMDYGIDLIEQQGKLHWKKFIYLFQGLSEDTKIKEIMSIRGRDLPKPTKYNQEEIEKLRELKAYYALGDTEENYQDGLNALWSNLENMATK